MGKRFQKWSIRGFGYGLCAFFSDCFGILVTIKKWPLKLPCQAGNKMTSWENQTLSLHFFSPPVMRLAITGASLCYSPHPSHLCSETAVSKWRHPLMYWAEDSDTNHTQQQRFSFVSLSIFRNSWFYLQEPCLASLSLPCASSQCSIICYEKYKKDSCRSGLSSSQPA